MPFGLQPIHLIVVAVVALIIFGPKNLPEIGRGMGKAIKEFRNGAREMSDGFRSEIHSDQPAPARPAGPAQMLAEPQAPVPVIGGNFCTHCGTANPVGARFCNRCGSPMAVVPVEPAASPANPEILDQ